MIRLAKLTDYGIALMCHVARAGGGTFSARELADATHIPLPTVSKLLKMLTAAGMLQSQRGVHGGYSLTIDPALTSLADVVAALEGPISLTECEGESSACAIEGSCKVKPHWHKINIAVRDALDRLSLADMASAQLPSEPTLVRAPGRRPIQETA